MCSQTQSAGAQATEAIVSFARRTGKPFAVVPCCVFPDQNPQRLLAGQPVRLHEDLIAYLVSLDPSHIRTAELMFEGRRTVVYCQGWL